MDSHQQPNAGATRPRYKWPWFVLAAVILGLVLAVLWMSQEIQRARRIRDANAPTPAEGQREAPAR